MTSRRNSPRQRGAPIDAGFPKMLGPLLGLKLLFALCWLYILLHLQDPQFKGKAFEGRLIAYPLIAFAIPVVWWFLHRSGRGGGYPYVSDFLLTLGLVFDLLGNIFDLFNTVPWYDDLMHLTNWAFYSGAFGVLLLRTQLSPGAILAYTTGFGAITAILWEGVEWYTFIRFGTELATAYEDTLLDEHLGLLGSFIAGAILSRVAANRGRLAETPSGGSS